MSENTMKRADLTTLGGIAQAREDLYNQLAAGTIPEARANIAERILRGQVNVKGEIPMRFAKMLVGIASAKGNATLEGYAMQALEDLAGFMRPPAAALAEAPPS